jgi:hypothetical protein
MATRALGIVQFDQFGKVVDIALPGHEERYTLEELSEIITFMKQFMNGNIAIVEFESENDNESGAVLTSAA